MRTKTLLAIACAAVALSGCGYLKSTKSRLDLLESKSPCGGAAKALVVMLPGRFDDPGDFMKQGFVDALRARRIDADVVMPDLHFGYYREKSAVVRLHDDVIGAARAKGYKEVWLAGISLGGLGSILYAQEHADRLRGMLLIAPYLGEKDVQEEIRDAGGLDNWSPRQPEAEDFQRRLWLWLRGQSRQAKMKPDIYIGYGTEDDFAPANSLLAAALPIEQVMLTMGGHDWQPWLRVWDQFLDMKLLPVCGR